MNLEKFNKNIYPYLKWGGRALLLGGLTFTGYKVQKSIQKRNLAKNLPVLLNLADENRNGQLEEYELKEIHNACGGKVYLFDGKPHLLLTNKQVKKGIEYFENRNKKWV